MDGTTPMTLFVTAALALLLTPGPAVLYIVTRAMEQGRVAGLVSGLGLSCGGLVHVVAAAFGLSAILATSSLAFGVVKLAGAAYLILLGIRTILAGRRETPGTPVGKRPLRRIFLDGIVVNLLNPKAALFFFAFLPQFVDPARGGVARQILTLGLIFIGLGLLTDAAYALVAGTVGHWLRRSRGVVKAQRYVAGLVYLGLGLASALVRSR